MKNKIIVKVIAALMLVIVIGACDDSLEMIPVDEFAPGNALQSEEGITALLYAAYNEYSLGVPVRDVILVNEVTTDVSIVRIGAVEREMRQMMDFNWDPAGSHFQGLFWAPRYRAIRNANTLLDNINNSDVDESFKTKMIAEARYIRASEYAFMYSYYGLVPLRTTNDQTVQPKEFGLPTEEEFLTFVETELNEAAQNLPDPSEQIFGRANKGTAYAQLTKFLMNTKQWQKVVNATQSLMDLDYYELFPDYRATFFVENEPQNNPNNKEIIETTSLINVIDRNNNYQNGAFPPGFKRADNIPEFEWTSSMANWPTQFSLRDEFVDSFDPDDKRKEAIVEEYYNVAGNLVNLRTANTDNSRSLKYFDNDQIGNSSGADVPYLRYADILICRAEALNELEGPTQEAVDLVNEIRNRAEVAEYSLVDIGSKEHFRNLILDERGWEFFSEGKRREDLIRHGKFLEFAEERGLTTQPYQVYFPYPQAEIDANPALEQREGY